jgi:hypothetical protein
LQVGELAVAFPTTRFHLALLGAFSLSLFNKHEGQWSPKAVYNMKHDILGIQEMEDNEEIEREDLGAIVVPFNPNQIKITTRPESMQMILERLEHHEINLNPDFQRDFVWDEKKQSRLIESMILKLPIPPFYFDGKDDNRWEVVDGLQRLSTVKRFVLDGILKLDGLEFLQQLNGLHFHELSREMQRRIKSYSITVHIIEAGTPDEVKYNIFKRINTGGVVLEPQEIRHALHQGVAAAFVKELSETEAFREATNHAIRTKRMEDRDFATRFLTFYLHPDLQDYVSDLDGYMSKTMGELQRTTEAERAGIKAAFIRAMEASLAIFGNDAFRKRYDQNDTRKPINKALFEVLSVSFARLPEAELACVVARGATFRELFVAKMHEDKFRRSITQGTAKRDAIDTRMEAIGTIIKQTLSTHD